MSFTDPIPEGTICARCGKNPATEVFSEGGVLAANHGFYELWCRLCVLVVQLDAAEAAHKRIPDIVAEMHALAPSLSRRSET